MRHVIAGVDEARAREIFNRGWGAKLHGFRALFFSGQSNKRSFGMERVWMPAYLVTFAIKSPRGDSDLTCFVDACSGSFALFDMHESLSDSPELSTPHAATLAEREAEEIARQELLKVILRRRSRAGKPVPGETLSIEILSYPYWVYYYHRRSDIIDIRVLDAATGRLVGNKIKLAILDAFKAEARRRNGDSDE